MWSSVFLELLSVTDGDSGKKRGIDRGRRKEGPGDGPARSGWSPCRFQKCSGQDYPTPSVGGQASHSSAAQLSLSPRPQVPWEGGTSQHSGGGYRSARTRPRRALCFVVPRRNREASLPVIFLTASPPPPEGASPFWPNIRNLIFNVKRETVRKSGSLSCALWQL